MRMQRQALWASKSVFHILIFPELYANKYDMKTRRELANMNASLELPRSPNRRTEENRTEKGERKT